MVRSARIHVYYAFSPGLIPQISHLKLIMNGTLFATIQPAPGQFGGSDGRDFDAEFTIPPELLVHNNTLTIEFIGHYVFVCEDPANTTLWARVHRNTFLEIDGDLLPLADDLKQLPQPFVDPAVIQPPVVSVIFPAPPSYKAIQAAGIVTSYFGLVSENRPVRFPVHIGAIPTGNAIVIAENPASLPPGLNLPAASGPTVAMRTNPNDPYGKILIVTGGNADDLVTAAQAIALHSDMLNGAQVPIENLKLPSKQAPDSAPRWARTDQTIPLWDYTAAEQLQGDGTAPLNVYFRIPPDLYYATGGTEYDPAPGLSLQLHSHRTHLQHAGARQQRIPWLQSAHPRTGIFAQDHARRARSRRQPAPLFQLAVVRFHLPVAQERKVRRHDAHQHAGRHP